jgi:hypothetical protein
MLKLYEISSKYINAFNEMRDIDELPYDVIKDTLESIEGEFEEKSLSVASYFQSLDAESEALKEAAKRIQARQKAIENHSASLKAYLLHNMLRTGITSIKCPEFEVKLAKCPPSVEITDESLLPDVFMRIKKEPDKALIKQFILDNGELDGARLVDDKMRLQIK